MSTKTSIKRIALVAVSALGFGLLSVVPAGATTLATLALTTPTVTVRVAEEAKTTFSITSGGTFNATDKATFSLTLTKVPAASGLQIEDANTSQAAASATGKATINDAGELTDWTDGVDSSTPKKYTLTAATAAIASATVAGTISVKPDVPGTYEITLTGVTTPTSSTKSAVFTIIVLPTTSTTSTLTATKDQAVYPAADNDAVITVSRNVGGVKTDGQILGRVDFTSNSTSSGAVGTIFGTTAAKASGMTGSLAADNQGTKFTMDIDVIANVGAGVYATAGDYTFTFFQDTNSNAVLDSGEPTTSITITIGAASGTTSLISASLSRTLASKTTGVNTFTVTATVTDAVGNPTTATVYAAETAKDGSALGAAGYTDVSNLISTNGSVLTRIGSTNTYTGTFTVDTAYTAGDYIDTYITVYTSAITADATTSAKKALRIANDNGDALMTTTMVAGSKALVLNQSTTDTPVGSVTDGVRQTLSVGAAAGASTGTIGTSSAPILVDKTYTTHTYTINGAVGSEGEYVKVAIAPTNVTSNATVAASTYLLAIGADLTATFSVTATSPVADDGYTVTVSDDADGTPTSVIAYVDFATATPQWSTSPSKSYTEKIGNSVTIKGVLTDIFGRVLASKPVTWTVTGRNVNQGNLTTDATGAATLTYTDTATSTTALKDTITFGYAYQSSATSTTLTTKSSTGIVVTFSATGIVVGSVVVAAPSATTTRAIDMAQGAAGATSTLRVSYIATVKKADGTPVGAGALVTFSGGADDLFFGGITSGVTDEFGQASVSVYRQKVGTPSITATAGGVTSSVAAAVKWVNDLPETGAIAANAAVADSADFNARYITLTADQAKVVSEGIVRFTAKVTDRFGNAVAGVEVTFSETGAGRFYNAPSGNKGDTNSAGEISIDLNSQAGETGTASVSASITDARALQVNDTAGFMKYTASVTNASPQVGATAVTQQISGLTAAVKSATATATIEKSTAVSTADALLELAKAIGTGNSANAAADAALEAIDAANAATDAANLAAEAADAATVAAEEARDAADAATAAVEALASEVATLVAALKAQITTLANTVAKIAKRVRA